MTTLLLSDAGLVLLQRDINKINRQRKKDNLSEITFAYMPVEIKLDDPYIACITKAQVVVDDHGAYKRELTPLEKISTNTAYSLAIGYRLLPYLALVTTLAEEYGFTTATQTRDDKIATYIHANVLLGSALRGLGEIKLSPRNIDIANKILQFIKSHADTEDGYIEQLKNIVERGYFYWNETALVASMYLAWKRENALGNSKSTSSFIGTVGSKIEITAKVLRQSKIENDFGVAYLTILEDKNGNIYKWYAKIELPINQDIRLSAKIKAHSVFQNQHQTEIYYCKVL